MNQASARHPLQLLAAAALLLGLLLVHDATAAPYTPTDDTRVLELLPLRGKLSARAELQALRKAWAADRQNPEAAATLAIRQVQQAMSEGDPRYVGQAQAVLQPWWKEAGAPNAVRLAKALVWQYQHAFDQALQELREVTAAEPGNLQAWSWLAAIQMVRADYDGARTACARLDEAGVQHQDLRLAASACRAHADSLSGQAPRAARELAQALQRHAQADALTRAWALTRLAEIEERLGQHGPAEQHYRLALQLQQAQGLSDAYLLAAYADFLLDRRRPAEVMALLREQGRVDALLLRLALAAQMLGRAEWQAWRDELGARLQAARVQGNSTHNKEEARWALLLVGDAPRALDLAQRNWSAQREPSDARMLMEAALAARRPEAAEPALQWMKRHQVQSVVLQDLALQLQKMAPPVQSSHQGPAASDLLRSGGRS